MKRKIDWSTADEIITAARETYFGDADYTPDPDPDGYCGEADGHCNEVSELVATMLAERGYKARVVVGTFIGNHHCWVVCGNTILDATVDQYNHWFGREFPFLSNVDNVDYVPERKSS